MVMMNNPGRTALNELMREAERYVLFQMNTSGECPPRLYMDGSEGRHIFTPRSLASEKHKDDFARLARLTCVAHTADATVMVSESWMVSAKNGKPPDLAVAPSQSPDREEVVTLMGESREGMRQKIFPLLRHQNGKFKGLGEAREMEADTPAGRFTHFVPAEPPTRQEREEARAILEGEGLIKARKKEEREERGMER